MNRRRFLTTTLAAVTVTAAGCLSQTPEPEEPATFGSATTYFDSSCECCVLHSEYLEAGGVTVTEEEVSIESLLALKDEYQIPNEYRSCHTTIIDTGHVIEGHVPVDVMNEVVERAPSAEVIALPGMPEGSPGMPGSKDGDWIFYAIEDGKVSEFTRR